MVAAYFAAVFWVSFGRPAVKLILSERAQVRTPIGRPVSCVSLCWVGFLRRGGQVPCLCASKFKSQASRFLSFFDIQNESCAPASCKSSAQRRRIAGRHGRFVEKSANIYAAASGRRRAPAAGGRP